MGNTSIDPVNCGDGSLLPHAPTSNDVGELVHFVSGVKHCEGNSDPVPLGRYAHLVMRKVFQPAFPGQIQDINVRPMVARARADDPDALLIHVIHEPLTKVQDVIGDLFYTNTEKRIMSRRETCSATRRERRL